VSETDYFYDNGATTTPCSTAGSSSVSGAGGTSLTGHDATNYGASSTATRGNLTQKTQWLSSGSPATTYTYDETGQVLAMTDPNGNQTSYSYADAFLNTNSTGFTSTAGAPPTGEVTNAYLTKITYPFVNGIAQTENFSYGYNDGELTRSSDQNSKATTYVYNDSLGRLTESDYPDTGQTLVTYSDSPPSPSVTTKRLISSGSYLTSVSTMDGLGHVVKTALTSDPDCSTGDITAITYDGLGRVYTSSNPYCTTSDATYGLNTYTYDALGRITAIAHPDSTTINTSYAGRATDVVDEGNGTRRTEKVTQRDGLGRLLSVCEVTSSSLIGAGKTPAACGQDINKTGFLTTYTYDALDNLLTVNQGGLSPRTFVYDSLSRLLCSANPEMGGSAGCPNPDNGAYTAGTTRYSYDTNGNLVSRVRPAPNQQSLSTTVTTSYQYDALNRVTATSYSDGVTLPAVFAYDQTKITMGTQQFNIVNSIGRLSWSCTQLSSGSCNGTMAVHSYDPLGRITRIWQQNPVNNNNINVSYTYDLIGDETDKNLSGNDYASTYNTAGRLTAFTNTNFTDATNPANLLTNGRYNALGRLISTTLANGLTESWGYDIRGRLQAMAAGTTCTGGKCTGSTAYGFSINTSTGQTGYAPNGAVLSAADSVDGNWSYTYDDFNRLSTSTCSGTCPDSSSTQGFSYSYDRYGNRWQQTLTSGSGPQSSYTFTNNRLDGYSYDAVGDLLNDGFHNYQYDPEGRIISVDGGATAYIYDARGNRVVKTTAGVAIDYIYDRDGHVILYNQNPGVGGSPFIEQYVAGMHLGTYILNSNVTDSIFYYDHSDWLGTERAHTNVAGVTCETMQSLPFGDGQVIHTMNGGCTATTDVSPMHFTGKERDSESGLDYFDRRHFASTMGRWVTPDRVNVTEDRLLSPTNTLNKYVYGGNNPLKYVDTDGEDITVFYDQGGTAGHIVLLAYDQQSGNSAVQSFGPQNHDAVTRVEELFSIPVPGKDNYGFDNITSADQLRQQYASITIQTSPQEAQEAIQYIRTHPGGKYVTLGNNCTTTCTRILRKLQLYSYAPLAPNAFFTTLADQYSKHASFQWPNNVPRNGMEYGDPRRGYDPFDLLFLSMQKQLREKATSKICWTDETGKKVCQ
jgi:RHS repeat-associated protein